MTCRWPLLLDRGRQGESTHLIYMPWDRLHALSGDNLLANPKKEQFVPNVEQRLSICMGKHDFTCTNLQIGFGSRRNVRVPEHSASVSRFGKPDIQLCLYWEHRQGEAEWAEQPYRRNRFEVLWTYQGEKKKKKDFLPLILWTGGAFMYSKNFSRIVFVAHKIQLRMNMTTLWSPCRMQCMQ